MGGAGFVGKTDFLRTIAFISSFFTNVKMFFGWHVFNVLPKSYKQFCQQISTGYLQRFPDPIMLVDRQNHV